SIISRTKLYHSPTPDCLYTCEAEHDEYAVTHDVDTDEEIRQPDRYARIGMGDVVGQGEKAQFNQVADQHQQGEQWQCPARSWLSHQGVDHAPVRDGVYNSEDDGDDFTLDDTIKEGNGQTKG